MSDLIDRQDAKDVVDMELDAIDHVPPWVYDKLLNALNEVPSAQPQKGKWTRHFDGNEWYWYCSSCKEQWYEEDLWMGGNSFPNFCPNCGSYNGGEQTGWDMTL